MADYIERSVAVRRVMETKWECGSDGAAAMEIVASAPAADVVRVVRCKDCEKSDVTEFGKRYCKEPMGSFYGCIPVEDDYFCSGGRRKEGAE